jgi:multiple sugar transport system ATP-binding protein
MNLLQGTLKRDGDGLAVQIGDATLVLDQALIARRPGLPAFDGREVIVGIRPEDLEDAALAPDTPAGRRLRGEVALNEALGSEIMAHVNVAARPAVTDETRELAEDVGTAGATGDAPTAMVVGRFSPRSRVKPGDPIEVAVDTSALHFFDPGTGLGIYDNGGTRT